MISKDEMRREMRKRLQTLDASERACASAAIREAIVKNPAWQRAKRIGAFHPLSQEPELSPLWKQTSAQLHFPRIREGLLEFVWVRNPEALESAHWDLREPEFDALPAVDPGVFDVILVPGIAFTPQGHRLGRGRGYYDRILAAAHAAATTLGVCFARQIVSELPVEAHDRSVTAVVTECSVVV